MNPPLMTSSGRAPKSAGRQSTRSASLPTSTEPTSCAIPCESAGLIVYFATYADDARRVPAARALRMIGVDGATLEGRDRVVHVARLVQGVGVDGHLHVLAFGDSQAAVDGGRRGPPVLVEFQPDCPAPDLL